MRILIGNTTYEDNIYVAPIEDKMLLGLNFLRRVGASAHLASDILTIGNEQVKMKFGGTSDSVKSVACNSGGMGNDSSQNGHQDSL